jgi:hypothetical protein
MKEKQEEQKASMVTFLLPCYNTPILSSDFLHTVLETKQFDRCAFALLLQNDDPNLGVYKELTRSIREKGLDAGYFVFDGTPYCGMINRVAPIINTHSLCVLNNQHFPYCTGAPIIDIAGAIESWLKQSLEPMRVGVFDKLGNYPVVTKQLIERLGYMFHPLCFGREEAERWLLILAERLKIIGMIPNCRILQSNVETLDISGFSTEEESSWVLKTLMQMTDDETQRLEKYLLK